ncbi:MAG: hypothetical protein WKF87_01935 [Chryseolinea sp.]
MIQPLLLKSALIITFSLVITLANAQQKIEILHLKREVSLRGLSVVTDNIVWVSVSNGTIGRSVDGGKTWQWSTVPGYESRDFRDIEAFDDHTAVIVAIASPAHILRTIDGGVTWKLVYENNNKQMFLDAMDFTGDLNGTVVGDAIDGKLFVAHTKDGGKTWKEQVKSIVAADSTEGCFASSGTNIRVVANEKYFFVTGGKESRLISERNVQEMPFDQSKSSTGANSLAIRTSRGNMPSLLIAVGGDFAADSLSTNNCFVSKDNGSSWSTPNVPPGGYRSCVEFISEKRLITCGLNGVDISEDEGTNWIKISSDSFHACRKAKKGSAVFLSGSNGRIGKLVH